MVLVSMTQTAWYISTLAFFSLSVSPVESLYSIAKSRSILYMNSAAPCRASGVEGLRVDELTEGSEAVFELRRHRLFADFLALFDNLIEHGEDFGA